MTESWNEISTVPRDGVLLNLCQIDASGTTTSPVRKMAFGSVGSGNTVVEAWLSDDREAIWPDIADGGPTHWNFA